MGHLPNMRPSVEHLAPFTLLLFLLEFIARHVKEGNEFIIAEPPVFLSRHQDTVPEGFV